MLIEFKVSNFRSFKDEQTLSLVAGRDSSHPESLIPVDDDHLLKTVALYGANASGKSNLIRAMMVMRDFVVGSATKMNQGDRIDGISPFRLSEETSGQPSRFEIMIMVGSSCYEYGFSASDERVYGEWLYAKPAVGNRRQLFQRTCPPDGGAAHWDFGVALRKEGPLLRERTRDNGLVLSRGAELNMPELSTVFLWFRNGLDLYDMSHPPSGLIRKTADGIKRDETLCKRVSMLLSDSDVGITGIVPAQEPMELPEELIGRFSFETWAKVMAKSRAKTAVHTKHRMADTGADVEFDLERDESNGTQRLFALAGPIFRALDNGTAVVADELECSMHPLLTRKLIELFQSAELNKKGAQLIFATHDVTLMDPQLLRRDQIWLVEKKSEGASELFSLYDFKEDAKDARPRSTEAFLRRYLAGRYGGVPVFGSTLEDLEFE